MIYAKEARLSMSSVQYLLHSPRSNPESRTSELTQTVMETPRMSMTTWIVVEEWAGSMPSFFIPRGINAPRMMLMMTIMKRLVVIARVSRKGVIKIAARIHPAVPNIRLSAVPMITSRPKTALVLESSMVPTARPLITA